MNSGFLSAIGDHLWQSTLFAAAAGLLTLAFRKNAARARYGLWLAASLKFLFPFSLLVWGGSLLPWHPAGAAVPQMALWLAASPVSRPFVPNVAPVPAPVHLSTLGFWEAMLLAVWGCGTLVVAFNWVRRWISLRNSARAARPLAGLEREVPVLSTPFLQEPGVF